MKKIFLVSVFFLIVALVFVTNIEKANAQACGDGTAANGWCAFITSVTYTGNLCGLSGADAKCQTLATAAGLPGTYKAWLSDGTTDAAARLNHPAITIPYKLVNGTIVAWGWTGLTSGNPIYIDFDENGNPPGLPGSVWTGTYLSGSKYICPGGCLESYCQNWTSGNAADYGTFGIYNCHVPPCMQNPGIVWSALCLNCATRSCGLTMHLYCIQQDTAAPAPTASCACAGGTCCSGGNCTGPTVPSNGADCPTAQCCLNATDCPATCAAPATNPHNECIGGVCTSVATCAVTNCAACPGGCNNNGVQDNGETGIDCGGGCCPACAAAPVCGTCEGGIVPCGRNCDDPATSWNECDPCTVCHFFLMIQTIINFVLFKIVIPIAVLLLVFGGAMFIFSAGNQNRLDQGKSIMMSVAIGLVIIFGAWLLVNAILTWTGLINPAFIGWPTHWFEIDCH